MQRNPDTYGGLERFWQTPAHLSARSAEIWRELVPCETRSPERLALLQLALENLDMADDCNRRLATEGLTIKTLGSGNLRAHPALRIRADAMANFIRCWRLLGLHYSKAVDGVPLDRLRTADTATESEPSPEAIDAEYDVHDENES